ncbi:hypothetical protein ACROYT_G027448 [Oculina patagonica]
MSGRKLRITLLADEWKSSKGGLSTMNRELAIQLAKHSNVDVTFFVPKCTADDKKAANSHGISIVEAKERPGFEPNEWLCFPSSDLVIDIIIGHGVKLGKQAQVIRDSHHCTWVQVVHTAPEELAMFKDYSSAISKGDEKQWIEVNLCKIADLVVAVGPKLHEFYSAYLISCDKNVFNLTPGIFTELSTLKLSTKGAKKFRVLVFGRGDSEDFELKGFDIAAKAVAELNDRSYHLIFVGAPSGNEKQVADRLLKQGLNRSQLTVKGYLENRDDLATLLSTANLAIIPSRTEGFGLTALEALSAGLPFLVSQNSGFGEALQEIPWGSSWIVDSEDPEHWAEAIKGVREKGRVTALKECQELRTRYAEKYSWEKQCNHLVLTLAHNRAQMPQPAYASEPERKQMEGKSVPQEDQSVTKQRSEDISPSLTKKQSIQRICLFNCDGTYKLDIVESFLMAVKEKHGFQISVEKFVFRLNQMTDICENTIPQLQMDIAIFVVNAHESRLSINEDNAGIGYAKVYRALLQATEGKVLIVIGGDDQYRDKDKEERTVISRWAKRKVAFGSQFNEEYLDGRESFIFSWNKQHREIHEEALLHFLDPNKKGQKFEYRPKPKPVSKMEEPTTITSPAASYIQQESPSFSCPQSHLFLVHMLRRLRRTSDSRDESDKLNERRKESEQEKIFLR